MIGYDSGCSQQSDVSKNIEYMNKTVDTFIALLRSAVMGSNEEIDLADVNFEALYSLSSFHDLAHVVFFELSKRIGQWQGEIFQRFERRYDKALYRFVKRDTAIGKVRKALEDAGIPFVLLKGARLMDLYPEAWMRTSSDLDVLVEQGNYKKAVEALKTSGLVFFRETPHDASLFTESNYHVELHHSLVEEGRLPKTTGILEQVWKYTTPIDGRFERKLDDEMFYFYHLAHMAKHLKKGGCGVRYFIDLWLLNHRTQFDMNKRDSLIGKSGLSEFADKSVQLSEKWFSSEQVQTDISEFEEFIIRGGILGSAESIAAMRKNVSKTRFRYYFERIFMPYNKIKYKYPVLKRFPILLPFCWVWRWFGLFNPKTRKYVINEMKVEDRTDSESVAGVERLMKQLKI